MDKTLAAAFGISANQILRSLNELKDAYKTLTDAGYKLTAEDKRQFDEYVKKVVELAVFLNDVETQQYINTQ